MVGKGSGAEGGWAGSVWAGLAALALAAAALALAAVPAAADTGDIIAPSDPDNPTVDSGWQAGTCTDDGPPVCSVDTPEKFFETASAHPPIGFTQFIVKSTAGPLGPVPVGSIKTIRVDLPEGLTVNPQATPQCAEVANPGACPANTQVGISNIQAVVLATGLPMPISAPVYNMVPKDGEPALFGLTPLPGTNVFLEADVAWEGNYHEYFTIHLHEVLGGVAKVLSNRLSFDGRSGDGTFITTPSTCFDPEAPPHEQTYSTFLRADSFEVPDPNFPNGSTPFESPLPPGTGPKDCPGIPYDPSVEAEPETAQTDSPSGLLTRFELPHLTGGDERESSHTKRGVVTLPLGMGLNPSAANGLVACTDAEFGKGTRNPIACPAASKIGTVTVETPPLPPGALSGNVYIGNQLSRDPASGDLYRIFVAAESARYDISARLLGRVSADPGTGQVTAVFDDEQLDGLPQVPFSELTIDLDDGPHATLTSPPTCGPHQLGASMTPWSGNPAATPSDDFVLTSSPAGGGCAASGGARPFAPGLAASGSNPRGGDFTTTTIELTRGEGEQELKAATVILPPGLTAKLAGVRYCPEAAIAAASANAGAAEAALASCPASSHVGSAVVRAGSGPDPLQIAGRAFLAGPYRGAPLSLAIVTPATAGPFDLGSVVVRVALFLHRETAQVHAVTDLIPHVFGGALLDIRSATISLNRPGFALNPTNCDPLAFGGIAKGGADDPNNPATFSTAPISAGFQVRDCNRLDFKPKLFLRLFGATRRAKNPKLRAVLQARRGDANISRAAVTLPKGLLLDQSAIAQVCTRVQFAANACPKRSRYGWAQAFTPLLDEPLKGPVYLRSSDNQLPDLVASLNGQVGIDLVGRTDSVRGRIRNVFQTVPDVPVSKFMLTVRGGKKGLLTNSRNLCPKGKKAKRRAKRRFKATVRFRAQNGKKANSKRKVRIGCGKKRRAGKRR